MIWFGGHRVDSGQMQVGALTAFLSYLMQILMCDHDGHVHADDGPALVGVRRPDRRGARHPHQRRAAGRPGAELALHGHLDLEDVSFTYPGAEQPVLCDVGFSARPGETVAVIGSTGAGKSTLVNLVPRLFDATSGTVRIDGVDVRDLDPELLWSRIGLVPQKAFLFTGTVASNLLHGKPDATDEELWHALEIAQARDFVERDARGPRRARSCRAAPTSREVSGSGWRSPGRWYAVPRSTSSTTRSPPSTWPPTPGSARR